MSQLGNWFKAIFKSLPAAGSGADAAARDKNPLWERGENAAAKYLRSQNFRIITRNYRCDAGEIDIIARDAQVLVFVEVKTRAYDDPTPEEQVNEHKQHQLTKAAKVYLTRYGYPQPPARFDVVAVVWPQGGRDPIIRHTRDAFEATF
jgi:putative endonuclease